MFRLVFPILICVSLVASAADLKYSKKIKDASGEHGALTFYFQGQRIRIDHRNEVGYGWKDGSPETLAFGPRMATIYQCDMHRVLQLDFDHHQYTVTEFNKDGTPTNAAPSPFPSRPGGAKVKLTVETRDTGETKQVFGQTARRFVTDRKQVPSPGACAVAQETTEDGWYIDVDRSQQTCMEGKLPSGPAVTVLVSANCNDDFEVQQIGPLLPRFPVEVSVTTHGGGSGANHSMTAAVTDFSRLPLEPQIFDLPTGYKHVDKLDDSPSLPWLLRGKLMWQSAKTTVWGWTPWGK
jgi:hypothetical protein